MPDQFSRTRMLLGEEAMERLRRSTVAVFGVGGVGSAVVEALARCGVGGLALFDSDRVAPSNLNRQLPALHSTLGRKKVEVMRDRVLDINPGCAVTAYDCFYTAENAGEFDLGGYAYIADAIDTVSSKLVLIQRAKEAGVPIMSSMGAGNKLDPAAFEVADIYETSVCPLARVMRRELRKRGVPSLKVVYSREAPLTPREAADDAPSPGGAGGYAGRRQTPGSVSFVPPAAGFILASEIIRDLVGLPAAR